MPNFTPTPDQTRRLDEAAQEITKAEGQLARKQRHVVGYRISKENEQSPKGNYDFRRAHLIRRIQALGSPTRHLSTSLWTVSSGHAQDPLAELLGVALDLETDEVLVGTLVGTPTIHGPTKAARLLLVTKPK